MNRHINSNRQPEEFTRIRLPKKSENEIIGIVESLFNRNGSYNIYMYDIETKTERRITTDASYQGTPVIFGNFQIHIDRKLFIENRHKN